MDGKYACHKYVLPRQYTQVRAESLALEKVAEDISVLGKMFLGDITACPALFPTPFYQGQFPDFLNEGPGDF